MRPITPAQLRVYRAIVAYYASHGKPPSGRELAAATGTQIHNVNQHVKRLRRAGLIAPDTDTVSARAVILPAAARAAMAAAARILDVLPEDEERQEKKRAANIDVTAGHRNLF